MSRFFSYNTDDTNTGDQPLAANATLTIGPLEAGGCSRIGGSVFSDVAGTCNVQQSFDYWLPGNVPNPNAHWDVTQAFSITASTPTTIDIDVVAPVVQIYYVNGTSQQTHLRIFTRVFGPGR